MAKVKQSLRVEKPWKSKKQRRSWFKALSNEAKAVFIEQQVVKKQERRDAKMRQYMQANKLKFDCSKCCHGIGGHCTDQTEIGCTYFYDAINDKYGPAYKQIA